MVQVDIQLQPLKRWHTLLCIVTIYTYIPRSIAIVGILIPFERRM